MRTQNMKGDSTLNKIILSLLIVATSLLTGCQGDAQVASSNISKAADMFEINRRVVFYNGISGEYMLTIEGRCSIEPTNNKLSVTCKVSPNGFKKHYLGLSDNVTYFAEQIDLADVSVYHHRIVWKPQDIIPEIDLNVDGGELMNNRH